MTAAKPLGLIAFMGTVVMLFTAFTASYIIRKTGADWQPVHLPSMLWVGAAVLLGSSFTLELARRRGANWIDVTFFMGLGFVAIQTAALRELAGHGVFLQSSPHASFFYILTGLHGVHLLGGFGALVYAHLRPEKLGSCALYWHFLGGLWIYILLLLSLA